MLLVLSVPPVLRVRLVSRVTRAKPGRPVLLALRALSVLLVRLVLPVPRARRGRRV